jgi:hypothetical protein
MADSLHNPIPGPMTIGMGQADTKAHLATLFASKARVRVLELFMVDPSRAYYQRQIEAVTGIAIRGVQRELERLTGIGLLYRRAEGNRTYYQVDTHFPLFLELRALILKSGNDYDRLRGHLAVDEAVRLAVILEAENDVLVVSTGGQPPVFETSLPYTLNVLSIEEFTTALNARYEGVSKYLAHGADLLGRREDVIWRRIEALGHAVAKGKGVA